MSGYHLPASETRLSGYLDPPSPHLYKKVSKLDCLWQNFLDPHMRMLELVALFVLFCQGYACDRGIFLPCSFFQKLRHVYSRQYMYHSYAPQVQLIDVACQCQRTSISHKWASTREKLSSEVCEQQRRRPACASAQSDQRLCFSLIRKRHI